MRKSVRLMATARTLLNTLIQEAEMNPGFHMDNDMEGKPIYWPDPDDCTQIGIVFTTKTGEIWPMNFFKTPTEEIHKHVGNKIEKGH